MVNLNIRCYSLIDELLNIENSITVKELAKNLSASERTIRYDLIQIEEWLTYYNIKLSKKPKIGIWIEDRENAKKLLLKERPEVFKEKYQVYTVEERKSLILNILFLNDKPIHIDEFCDLLSVSKTTLINDINEVEKWLKERNICLIRKPKYGIKLVSDEKNWRKCVIEYLYENLDNEFIIDNLNKTKNLSLKNSRVNFFISNKLREIFKDIDIEEIEKNILVLEKELGIKFADNSFAAVLLHISLAIARLKKGENISMPKEQFDSLINTPEFSAAKGIGENLSKYFNVKIPNAEIGYITLHILGAKVIKGFKNENNKEIEYSPVVIKYVHDFIISLSQILNIDLSNDWELKDGLLLHLKPALKRYDYNLICSNPLLNQIKLDYSRIFNACKLTCNNMADSNGYFLSEDEIGYLAMHIGAAIERKKGDNIKSISAIVVCSTGIGTAKMLSTRLENEFPELNIVDNISLAEINNYPLDNIDIVITTISINTKLPINQIVVSPLLSLKDISKIEYAVNSNGNIKDKNKVISIDDIIQIVKKHCNIIDCPSLRRDLYNYINTRDIPIENNTKLTLDLKSILPVENIMVLDRTSDWKKALEISGEILISENFVERSYIDSITLSCEINNAYFVIRNGIAIAHAVNEKNVNKSSMSMLVLNNPVSFGKNNENLVSIVFTLAVYDKSINITALDEIMNISRSSELVKKIVESKDNKHVASLIGVL